MTKVLSGDMRSKHFRRASYERRGRSIRTANISSINCFTSQSSITAAAIYPVPCSLYLLVKVLSFQALLVIYLSASASLLSISSLLRISSKYTILSSALTLAALAALAGTTPQGFYSLPDFPRSLPQRRSFYARHSYLQLKIAPNISTADAVVTVRAVDEINTMVISASIASVSGVANRDSVTCMGLISRRGLNSRPPC